MKDTSDIARFDLLSSKIKASLETIDPHWHIVFISFWVLRQLSGFVCAYNPAAPGLSPKNTTYTFIIYIQICAIFVLWKRAKINKKMPGLAPKNIVYRILNLNAQKIVKQILKWEYLKQHSEQKETYLSGWKRVMASASTARVFTVT